jgi:hypothetical protein
VEGINIVANAVKITRGPTGRYLVLERSYVAPEIVNDGVTIARDIVLEDPETNVGAKLVQEVASTSDNKAGDGTTTSTLMTQEIVNARTFWRWRRRATPSRSRSRSCRGRLRPAVPNSRNGYYISRCNNMPISLVRKAVSRR